MNMRDIINIVVHGPLSESVFYKGEFTAPYSTSPQDIVILKDPSKTELTGLLNRATPVPGSQKELRGLLSDDELLVWDSTIASHDTIIKTFGVTGMSVYFYGNCFKMDDYVLRHPDMKAEAIEFVTKHPSIIRLYGRVSYGDDDQDGFCFKPERK